MIMEKLLAEFLFLNKSCPLPGIGELQIQHQPATYSQAEKTILPPMPEVVLVNRVSDEQPLLKYLSHILGSEMIQVKQLLKTWSEQVLNLRNGEKHIPGIGVFAVDGEGLLSFRSQQLHSSLQPEVVAEKVVRKENIHPILVGDIETNSEKMSEYYAASGKQFINLKWVAPAIFLLIIITTMVIYFTQTNRPGIFGTKLSVPAVESKAGYQSIP